MTSLALILLLLSLSTVLTYRPGNALMVVLYWFPAWLGQIFAPHWALLCILLALWLGFSAHNTTVPALGIPGTLLLAACLFLHTHRRGRHSSASLEPIIAGAAARLGQALPGTGLPGITGMKPGPLAGLRAFNFKRHGVVVSKDVAYGPAGRENCLDIYQPVIKPALAMPVLINIPGGAWVTGSKDQQALPLLYHMASQGWTCFNVNYRLGPAARFPAMLQDVLRAIAWVKTHAGEYGANPEFVAITGGSAGGHLLSLAALLREREQLQPGFEQVDTRVSVAVPIYGRYDFLNRHALLPGEGLKPFLSDKVMPGPPASCPELWDLASPESQVHAEAPPFLVVHGSADSMIPVEEAREFVRALRRVSKNPVDYAELPGAQHAYDMLCSSWAMSTVYAVSGFLCAHYAAHRQGVQRRVE